MSEPTLVLALAAGLASFLSPCMLPVIPAFLAQLAGTSLDVSGPKHRDVLIGTVLFVAGFSTVFALLGVVLGAVLQGAATEVLAWLSRLAGSVVIVLMVSASLCPSRRKTPRSGRSSTKSCSPTA